MNNQGLFKDNQGKPYIQKWDGGKKYRLERATHMPGGFFRIPLSMTLASRDSLDKNFILVCERGGGGRTFIEWLNKGQNTWEKHSLQSVCDLLEDHPDGDGRLLLLDRTQVQENTDDEDLTARLAACFESSSWRSSTSKLICLTFDISNLGEDLVFSSILNRGHIYRLPQFTVEELQNWVHTLTENVLSKRLAEDKVTTLAREVRWQTGGQPKMTDQLFQMVEVALIQDPKQPLLELFKSQSNELGKNTHLAHRWKPELEKLLLKRSLRLLLESYTGGTTKKSTGNFTYDEASLYLAGWIAENPDGNWGIRSRCHAKWARMILGGRL